MANSSDISIDLVTRDDAQKDASNPQAEASLTALQTVSSTGSQLSTPLRTDNGRNLSNFTASTRPGSRLRVIAACRSLGAIGYADTPIHEIDLAYRSTQRWFVSVQRFLDDPTCQSFFPSGNPSLQDIQRLATLHDKPVRPPKRFVCGAYGEHTRRRTPKLFHEALATAKTLQKDLDQHLHWIKPTMPLDQTTLDAMEVLLSKRRFKRWTGAYRLAVKSISAHMHADELLSRAIVSGNLERLYQTISEIDRFNEHVLYQRQLGPAFQGLFTRWHDLAVQIGYSQAVADVVQSTDLAADIVNNWRDMGEKLYAVARLASPASRRGRKLSKLANRLYTADSDIIYMLQRSQKAAARLSLWVTLIEAAEPEYHAYRYLTPRQILQTVAGISPADENYSAHSQASM